MTFKSVLLAVLLSGLAACSVQPPSERPAPRSGSAAPAVPALLSDLARVANLAPEQRRRELAALENGRRLDDARRFQLAALLEREDSVDAYERGLKALAAMEEADSRTQALVDLLKRALKDRIELKQQTARADELQDKLDQIKALEKSLQQRSSPAKAP
ncbi:MAG: hypothetical protein KJ889_03965 [Gammaproteobacteria bacterium]|nr:hypothetical protein [Gammaproteobacteria bacterium]